MRADLVISGAILALFLASPAQAQVTLDASNITCERTVGTPVIPATTGAQSATQAYIIVTTGMRAPHHDDMPARSLFVAKPHRSAEVLEAVRSFE